MMPDWLGILRRCPLLLGFLIVLVRLNGLVFHAGHGGSDRHAMVDRHGTAQVRAFGGRAALGPSLLALLHTLLLWAHFLPKQRPAEDCV